VKNLTIDDVKKIDPFSEDITKIFDKRKELNAWDVFNEKNLEIEDAVWLLCFAPWLDDGVKRRYAVWTASTMLTKHKVLKTPLWTALGKANEYSYGMVSSKKIEELFFQISEGLIKIARTPEEKVDSFAYGIWDTVNSAVSVDDSEAMWGTIFNSGWSHEVDWKSHIKIIKQLMRTIYL